jgi:hypothetical protein
VAVTIDELQVETRETPAQPGTPAGAVRKPQDNTDLRTALNRLRERDLRLQAD